MDYLYGKRVLKPLRSAAEEIDAQLFADEIRALERQLYLEKVKNASLLETLNIKFNHLCAYNRREIELYKNIARVFVFVVISFVFVAILFLLKPAV